MSSTIASADAVLDAAAGIEELDLAEHRAGQALGQLRGSARAACCRPCRGWIRSTGRRRGCSREPRSLQEVRWDAGKGAAGAPRGKEGGRVLWAAREVRRAAKRASRQRARGARAAGPWCVRRGAYLPVPSMRSRAWLLGRSGMLVRHLVQDVRLVDREVERRAVVRVWQRWQVAAVIRGGLRRRTPRAACPCRGSSRTGRSPAAARRLPSGSRRAACSRSRGSRCTPALASFFASTSVCHARECLVVFHWSYSALWQRWQNSAPR